MTFHRFDNGKPYAFDYHLKADFDAILAEIDAKRCRDGHTVVSRTLQNTFPVFLPETTRRISLYSYPSKTSFFWAYA